MPTRKLATKHDQQAPSEQKACEMIVYIAKRAEELGLQRWGVTKLNKILWLADFVAYGRTGKSITGMEYQRNTYGPTLTKFLQLQKKLEGKGIAIQERKVEEHTERRPIALREPDMAVFSPEEKALIDGAISKFGKLSARTISNMTHEEFAWLLVDMNETIPKELIFFTRRDLTDAEVQYGQALARTHRGG